MPSDPKIKVVVVAYRRWSFTRGSYCKALKNVGVMDRRSLLGGGRLLELVAHGGSTEYSITTQFFSDLDFNKVRNIYPKVN